jgi:hypothetical protein
MLGDIRNLRWLYIKAGLLLFVGLLASAILIIQCPSWSHAAVLAVAVWGFCRAYYFVFYVIEHYADPGYKFAGLMSFVKYAWSRQRGSRRD